MTLANPALEGVRACGTDGERAIIDGFRRNFRHATFLRCFIHFTDKARLYKDLKAEIYRRYFWKARWRYKICRADDMERYMVRHKRTEAGLGDPPIEFTTNNNKAANLVVKKHLDFQMKELDKFIEEIKELVEQQFRDEDRAIFRRGPYKVSEELRHLAVDSNRWAKISVARRQAAIAKFRKTEIDGRKLHLEAASSSISSSTNRESVEFSVTAETSGITPVAMPILAKMFNKAKELLRADPPIVIPQPASDNGAYLVDSYGNNTGICEHVLSVAHKKGNLQAFIKWFTKHGKKQSLLQLATNDGPGNAGKKPSKRKRSNAKRPLATVLVCNDDDAMSMPVEPRQKQQQQQPALAHQQQQQQPGPALHVHMKQQQQQQQPHAMFMQQHRIQQQQPRVARPKFDIKLIAGTTISRCYG
eukprot:gene15515-17099_t